MSKRNMWDLIRALFLVPPAIFGWLMIIFMLITTFAPGIKDLF
jgi:hypothetical protein